MSSLLADVVGHPQVAPECFVGLPAVEWLVEPIEGVDQGVELVRCEPDVDTAAGDGADHRTKETQRILLPRMERSAATLSTAWA